MTENTSNNAIVEAMFKVGAHFGFSKARRHPSTASYIFGAKNRVEIIDLEKTATLLAKAKEFMSKMGQENKVVLFVGGKAEAREAIEKGAGRIGMPFVSSRWIGGTMTNFPEIKKRIDKMLDLTSKREKGELVKYTKKERLMIDREIESLEKMFLGIVSLKQIPSAIFIVDSEHEVNALEEAIKSKVPVISISGTDCDISKINYPIVANDSSRNSVSFFVNELVSAYEAGKMKKA